MKLISFTRESVASAASSAAGVAPAKSSGRGGLDNGTPLYIYINIHGIEKHILFMRSYLFILNFLFVYRNMM